MELMPMPKAWAEKSGNIVWHRQHESVSLYNLVFLHRFGVKWADSLFVPGRTLCGHGEA